MHAHTALLVDDLPHLTPHHEALHDWRTEGTTVEDGWMCQAWALRTGTACPNDAVVGILVDGKTLGLCGGHFVGHRRGVIIRLARR